MAEITATQFKAKCLSLLDDVAAGSGELIVTKHGKPVAKVVPIDNEVDMRGSVTFLVSDEELIAPIGDEWDAEKGIL